MKLRRDLISTPLTFTVGKELLFSMQWERAERKDYYQHWVWDPSFLPKKQEKIRVQLCRNKALQKRDSKQKDLASTELLE